MYQQRETLCQLRRNPASSDHFTNSHFNFNLCFSGIFYYKCSLPSTFRLLDQNSAPVHSNVLHFTRTATLADIEGDHRQKAQTKLQDNSNTIYNSLCFHFVYLDNIFHSNFFSTLGYIGIRGILNHVHCPKFWKLENTVFRKLGMFLVEALLWTLWTKLLLTCGGWLELHFRYRPVWVGFLYTQILQKTIPLSTCKIWGFHGGDYEEWCLLGCYAVWLLYDVRCFFAAYVGC
jgi:hypothetical protein